MNPHPTDPAQLARWLTTPRTSASPAELACAVEHSRGSSHHITDFIVAAMLVVGLALIVVYWGE